MLNNSKPSPRETLKMKMIAAGPGQLIPLNSAEREYLTEVNFSEIVEEVKAIRSKTVAEPDHAAHLVQQEEGLHQMAGDTESVQREPSFEEVVKPLMQYLAKHHCPHSHIVVTYTGAELFHGVKNFNSFEFVSD